MFGYARYFIRSNRLDHIISRGAVIHPSTICATCIYLSELPSAHSRSRINRDPSVKPLRESVFKGYSNTIASETVMSGSVLSCPMFGKKAKRTHIEKIACVGAGLIGSSWATVFAQRGFPVVLQDLTDELLTDATKQIKSNIGFLAEKGLLRKDEGVAILRRIKSTTDLAEAVEAADYVQESVSESYEAKKAVFRDMDAAAAKITILASSSSALLMSEIQKATKDPQRCVLAHPWNPPHLMPLVEIAGGERTSKETVESTRKLMVRLGKVPIVLKREVPGYIANRIQAAVLREAIDIVEKGIASVEDVDRAVSAGPALRWAVTGPFMNHHLGGKGIERFMETLAPSYALRWRTMATWTAITPSAAKKIIEGVRETQMVRSKTMEQITRWRDSKVAELLRVFEFSASH
jgi:carnitine 3-dehydrogenase